jgi:tetratricopeptide (TPR) repeat protein
MCMTKIGWIAMIVLVAWPCTGWAQGRALTLGNEAFGQGHIQEAIVHYQQALRAQPGFGVHVNLGHCHMRLEQWAEAASAYQAAMDLDKTQMTDSVWRFLGQAYYAQALYQPAVEAFMHARSQGPDDQDTLWIARCLIELKQWAQAQSMLVDHLIVMPDSCEALELVAHVYARQDHHTAVVGAYERLVTLFPDQTRWRLSLARALVAERKWQRAIDTLEFAWRVDGQATQAIHVLLADLYLSQDMVHEAALCYVRCIRQSNPPTVDDLTRLARAYFQGGEWTSARKAYQAVLTQEPDHTDAELGLAGIEMQQGRLDEAYTYYVHLLDRDPNCIRARIGLAELHMTRDQYRNAADDWARLLELGDDRIEIHIRRLTALLQGGDLLATQAALESALAEYPAHDSLQRLLEQFVQQQPITERPKQEE